MLGFEFRPRIVVTTESRTQNVGGLAAVVVVVVVDDVDVVVVIVALGISLFVFWSA